MSETFKLDTLVTLIAAQQVQVATALGGSALLTIRDMAQPLENPGTGVVLALTQSDCPVLAPRARNFITGVTPALDTMGGDAAYKSLSYDLTYQLFFWPIGEGGGWPAFYGQNLVCVTQILLYFMTHTNQFSNWGAEEFFPNAVPALESQTDAVGTAFHGAEISFHVMHFLED